MSKKVDEVLSFIGDGALRENFLKLARGHQAAGKGEASEDYFHGEDRHSESGVILGSEIKLGGADQGDAECAEGVAERGSLRYGGHLHHAERDTDAAAEHKADGDPLIATMP